MSTKPLTQPDAPTEDEFECDRCDTTDHRFIAYRGKPHAQCLECGWICPAIPFAGMQLTILAQCYIDGKSVPGELSIPLDPTGLDNMRVDTYGYTPLESDRVIRDDGWSPGVFKLHREGFEGFPITVAVQDLATVAECLSAIASVGGVG